MFANYLTRMFRLLDAAIPPALGGKHAIVYERHPVRDRLLLSLWLPTLRGPKELLLYFDEDDFTKAPAAIVSECMIFAVRAVKVHEMAGSRKPLAGSPKSNLEPPSPVKTHA